jgi:hypothetical protein
MMTLHVAALVAAIVVGSAVQPASTMPQEGKDVTVRGCVERDAAARAPVYKLVAAGRIYQLEPAGNVDLAGALGHTVEATGAVSVRETARGRKENVLAVRAIKSVAPTCS